MKQRNVTNLILFSLIALTVLVFSVVGHIGTTITQSTFNLSYGSSTQGGGFVIFSTTDTKYATNGSSLTFGTFNGLSSLNLSGNVININLTLIQNTTQGQYGNVTFGWVLQTNGSTMLNTTIQNTTANQTAFNYSFNSNLLSDGIYNITVYAENVSQGIGAVGETRVVNYSRGYGIAIDRAAPAVSSFGINFSNGTNFTNTNFGSKILFQGMMNDSVTVPQGVRFGFNSGNGSEQNFTPVLVGNGSLYSLELAISQFTDGIYTVKVYVNDSLNNVNNSISNITVSLDRTAPNITEFFVGNLTDGAYLGADIAAVTANLLVNMSVVVNDSLLKVPVSVIFNVTNSSGTIFTPFLIFSGTKNNTYPHFYVANGTLPNILTAGGNSNHTPSAINISALSEGRYVIYVYANDSVGNRNSTVNFTFTVDRSKPTVSVSCSPSNPTSGQEVTCTCTASDALAGLVTPVTFQGGTGATESTKVTDSGTSSVCRVSDLAGNTNSATGSWTLAASTSGGSGPSGSSGGVSSSAAGTFEQKTWTSIFGDETAVMEIRNGEFALTQIQFAVSQTVYGAWLKVEKLDQAPSAAVKFDEKVYKNLELSKGLTLTPDVLKNVKIEFKVLKSWLKENKVEQGDVALHRYVDNTWTKLKTTFVNDDGTYVHYTAETPGFSYFLIGKASKEITPAATTEETTKPVTEEAVAPASEAASEAAPQEEPTVKIDEGASSSRVWLWVILALVIGGIVYYYWKKSTKKGSAPVKNKR